jgi:hypothetical protein
LLNSTLNRRNASGLSLKALIPRAVICHYRAVLHAITALRRVLGGLDAIHQLDQYHLGIVALARPQLVHTGITTRT